MEPPEDLLKKAKGKTVCQSTTNVTEQVASFHVLPVALSHENAISVDCAVRPLATAAEHGILAWAAYSSKVHRYN